MQDYIIRATAADGYIRAFAAVTTNMVKEARELHSLSPVASAALGRLLTASALMAKDLKNERDTLTIQMKGDGPLGGMIAVSDAYSNVRGYVNNPQVYLPLNSMGKLDVGAAIGKEGYLNVIKDLGLKEPYVGCVDLISGEVGEDISYYFSNSEQIPSVVALGVLVNKDESIATAGGYIIQLLPGADDSLVDYLEEKLCEVPAVTLAYSEGKTPEDMLEFILGEKGLKITDKSPCTYQCNCSRERMERNLLSIGASDLHEIIEDDKGAELHCHFCNKKYSFTTQELINLVESANS